jgi:hypothetical protein
MPNPKNPILTPLISTFRTRMLGVIALIRVIHDEIRVSILPLNGPRVHN